MPATFAPNTKETDSVSRTGSSRSVHSRRRTEMIKNRVRVIENLPQRKLLFRPKVYDWWKEGDAIDDETERLLRDIAEKEKKLMAKKRGDEQQDEFSCSDEENTVVKTLEKLKSRKQREQEYREKLENMKRKKEEDEIQEMEEKIKSEMQNPSIYGWFFTDGYYDNYPYFGVRQDLVEPLTAEQDAWIERWNKRYPETFTEKFRRFFWPPKYLCGKCCFRTRGSYLDFPEIIADWPQRAECNFDREPREYISNRHELFGLDEQQKEEEEMAEAQARAEAEEQQKLAEMEEKMIKEKIEEEERHKKSLEHPQDEFEDPETKKYGIYYDPPWMERARLRDPYMLKREQEQKKEVRKEYRKEKKKQEKRKEEKYKNLHWLNKGVSKAGDPKDLYDEGSNQNKQTLKERRQNWEKKF